MADKKTMIISLPVVWSIRNFILSGLNKELEETYDVYYTVPLVGKHSLAKYGIPDERVLVYEDSKRSTEFNRKFEVLKLAHRKRNPTHSDKVYDLWFGRDNKFSIRGSISKFIKNFMAQSIMSDKKFLKAQDELLALYDKTILPETIETVNKIKPDVVISTAFVVNWEWAIVRAAKLAGAKAYSFVLSFDNLTSRGYLPINFYDKYMLWNDSMKHELETMFLVDPKKINVTGTPQFDYHLNPKYLLGKEAVLGKFNLDQDDNYILYCANHINLTPNEPELLDELLTAFKNDAALSNHKVIVRLHPMDNYDRWNDVLEKHKQVSLSIPWAHDDKEAIYWGKPSHEDVVLYSNLLRYADVTLNIGSTVTLDAAMVNCPVICVGYHPNKGSVEDKTYYNFHFTEHYIPIMDSNAAIFALSKEEVLKGVKQYLDNRNLKEEERMALNSKLLKDLDGKSKERILGVING